MKQKAGTEKWEEGRDLLWEEAMKPSTLGAAMVAPSSRAPTTKPAISLPVSPSISSPSALVPTGDGWGCEDRSRELAEGRLVQSLRETEVGRVPRETLAWAENRKTKREKAHSNLPLLPQAQSNFVRQQKHRSFPTSIIQGLFDLLNLITSCSKKLATPSIPPKKKVLGFRTD